MTAEVVTQPCGYEVGSRVTERKLGMAVGVTVVSRHVMCVYASYNCVSALANEQLDAQFPYFIVLLLQSSTYFEQRRALHQEVKLY